MKKNRLQQILQYALFVFLNGFVLSLSAQDSTLTSTSKTVTTTTTNEFAGQPWMYVVGGVVAVILLIALLRPRNKEVRSTTVIREPGR